jgi:hypothetical protein
LNVNAHAKPWLALSLLLATGCSDPIIDYWVAKDNELEDYGCTRNTFNVTEDLTGDGQLTVLDEEGDCLICSFTLEVESRGDGAYEGTIEMEECTCDGEDELDIECDLSEDEETVDCAIVDSPCFSDDGMEFERG